MLPGPIVAQFTVDPEVQRHAVATLRILAVGYVFYGWGMVGMQAFNGAGDTRTPLAITLAGFFLVRLPLTAWLTWSEVPLPWGSASGATQIPGWGQGSIPGWGLGLWGCWLAMQVDLWVRGIAYFTAFSRRGPVVTPP